MDFKDSADRDNPLLYSKELISDLVLTGEDFDWLRAIDQDGCDTVEIVLERGGYSFDASIDIKQLRFEDARCKVSLSLSHEDPHECLSNRAGDDVDALRTINPDRHDIKFIAGEIETVSLTTDEGNLPDYPPVNGIEPALPPPDSNGWVLTSWRLIGIGIDGENPTLFVTYSREVITVAGSPPGDGWINIGGDNYVREIPVINPVINVTNTSVTYETSTINEDEVIDNTFLLRDIISWFVQDCGLSEWTSVFLGQNAPAVADPLVYDPIVYDRAYALFHHVLLAQKSDVKRANDAQNATRAPISWGDITELLKFWNCQIGYNQINGHLVIEHVSYFDRSDGYDFTVGEYANQLAGKEYYEGKGSELASKATFAWMDETTEAFDGVPITYACGNVSGVDEYVTKRFSTNVAFMLEDNPAVSDSGFAVIAAGRYEGDYIMINVQNRLFPSQVLINGAMATPNLHYYFFRHNANYPIGKINETSTVFFSIKPQRKTALTVKMCFDEYIAMDVADKVNIWYGRWSVTDRSWSDRNSQMTLSLEG